MGNSTDNPVVFEKEGWKVRQLTTWPFSASLHQCGWCTSNNKFTFENYLDKTSGNMFAIYKPKDRNTRPSYQVAVSDSGNVEFQGHGNSNIELQPFVNSAPSKLLGWLLDHGVMKPQELPESHHRYEPYPEVTPESVSALSLAVDACNLQTYSQVEYSDYGTISHTAGDGVVTTIDIMAHEARPSMVMDGEGNLIFDDGHGHSTVIDIKQMVETWVAER